MREHAATFHANQDYQFAIGIFIPNFAVFKTEICGSIFKRYLHEKEALYTPTFYMKMNHFNIFFHMTVANIWATWANFQPQARRIKKNPPWKSFLYFPEEKFFPHFGMAADKAVKVSCQPQARKTKKKQP